MFEFVMGFAVCYFAAGTAAAIRAARQPRPEFMRTRAYTTGVVVLSLFAWPLVFFDLEL